MKYRKILLAYNGSAEGKRALFEAADLAGFLNAETHLLAVASMPPSLFLTEGFVPEELLEEEKKRTQAVLDEGIRTLRDRGFKATGQLADAALHLGDRRCVVRSPSREGVLDGVLGKIVLSEPLRRPLVELERSPGVHRSYPYVAVDGSCTGDGGGALGEQRPGAR